MTFLCTLPGLSKIGLNEKMTAAVGYLPFQAPEVFMGNDYTEKADVYSFGMNVWFLFSGNQPEHGKYMPSRTLCGGGLNTDGWWWW
jgi:serine/threonine protein kinase